MNSGDTAFVLVSAALVLFMTPGLALFYGGMARSKNILNTLLQNYIMIGLIGVQWALFGYSLAFGPDTGSGLIGNLGYLGLQGVGAEPFKTYSETIPHQAFMVFQAMFAIITPALIIGSWVERFKFSTFLVFSLLWATLVYDPVAHWVWGDGGWLKGLGALDFAGGTVVHINAGIAALAAALIIGRRQGYGTEAMIPHNLPMTVLGAGILWFGWFGFNAGSALAANGLAAVAFVTTHFATCGPALSWMIVEWLVRQTHHVGHRLRSGGRPGGDYAGGGFRGSDLLLLSDPWQESLLHGGPDQAEAGYDDALDVVGVHMVGGIWGALATGLFASKAINEAGADGLFFGNRPSLASSCSRLGWLWFLFCYDLMLLKFWTPPWG